MYANVDFTSVYRHIHLYSYACKIQGIYVDSTQKSMIQNAHVLVPIYTYSPTMTESHINIYNYHLINTLLNRSATLSWSENTL